MIHTSAELTPRELETMRHDKDILQMQIDHEHNKKRLDLQLAIVEAKWASWLKIPVTIIKLPLFVLLGVAYICSMFTKRDMPEDFWRLLR